MKLKIKRPETLDARKARLEDSNPSFMGGLAMVSFSEGVRAAQAYVDIASLAPLSRNGERRGMRFVRTETFRDGSVSLHGGLAHSVGRDIAARPGLYMVLSRSGGANASIIAIESRPGGGKMYTEMSVAGMNTDAPKMVERHSDGLAVDESLNIAMSASDNDVDFVKVIDSGTRAVESDEVQSFIEADGMEPAQLREFGFVARALSAANLTIPYAQ